MAEKLTRDGLKAVVKEMLPELLREHPEVFADAFRSNSEGVLSALRAAGLNLAETMGAMAPGAVDAARREGIEEGIIVGGFGARHRQGLPTRAMVDPRTRKIRQTYIFGETERLANEWVTALMTRDGIHPSTGKTLRAYVEEMNKAVRAPATPMTNEPGTGGGYLVPTIIAAEIFAEMNERFVLQNRVQVFVSAAPLQIPRRIQQVTVTRGAGATALAEKDMAALLGAVKLSPKRVGALAYIEPQLALAAAVGPVRWVIGQLAEAMAKDLQRVIVAGNTAADEPRGINTLPTSGGSVYDRAKTAAWTNTDNQTKRDSFRKLYYQIAQPHREASSFLWIANNDVVQVMASLNDTNQQPFKDAQGGNPATFMGKEVVETSALETSGGTATALCADMAQYAYQESPDGLRIEQTTVGGDAWVTDTIGIKCVQWYDGSPVIPPCFGILPSVTV